MCVFVNNFSNDGLKLYLKYSCFKFNPVDRLVNRETILTISRDQ